MLTREDLARLCPRPGKPGAAQNWDFYVDGMTCNPHLFAEFGIDSRLKLVHLLAQWAHETGGFSIFWESGAYTVDGLMRVFGVGVHSANVTRSEAVKLCAKKGVVALDDGETAASKAYAIFERVYGLGNPKKARELGNTEPGDGYRYRGCGIVQITGRAAHEEYFAGDYSAENVIRAALKEWAAKDCGSCAEADDCRRVTRKINGGFNGLAEREAYLAKAKRIWTEAPDWGHAIDAPAMTAVPNIGPAVTPDAPGPAKTEGRINVETAIELAKTSRKWVVARILKWKGAAVAGFAAVGLSPDDPIGAAREARLLWSEFGLALVLIVGIAVWLFGARLQSLMVSDRREGRSIPSGSTNNA